MIEKKVAVVTGGSRGIGFETVSTFLKAGFHVAFCSRSKTNTEQAQEDLAKFGKPFSMVTDVRRAGQVKLFIRKSIEQFGRIDVLVNNAGVSWQGDFERQPVKSIDEIIDVNVKGLLYTTREVLPRMLVQKSGIIINISSGAGLTGIARIATYSASKFAVIGLTQSLASELKSKGIRVYAICPGEVATDMQVSVSGKMGGIPPKKVAQKILALTGTNPSISSGEFLEVYR